MLYPFIVFIFFSSALKADSSVYFSDQVFSTVKRLEQHITFLFDFNKNYKKTQFFGHNPLRIDIHRAQFDHDLIRWAVKKIQCEHCYDVLFDIWKTFKNHHALDIDDDYLFLHDFSTLIFIIYNTILQGLLRQEIRIPINDVIALYSQISSLPLPELLDLLDQCLAKLNAALQVYQTTSTISWTQIVGKYWWIPPVILIGIWVSLVRPTNSFHLWQYRR